MDLLLSIDRDLLFFFNTDDQQKQPLLFLKQKKHKHLTKLVKRVHQNIFRLQRTITDESSAQHSNACFFQQKQTKQLYHSLVTLRNQYQAAMQQLQIRPLENDRERYEQLQAIHNLSRRLDATGQVYEELHFLSRALTLLRQEWKLDQIQQIVSTLATPSSPQCHGDHGANKKPRSIKNWFRRTNGKNGNNPNKKSTDNAPHLLVAPNSIQQLILDFQDVFEENARQNQDLMHQLYPSVFHPTDPLLAEDIQRLCMVLVSAPPPILASLCPPTCQLAVDMDGFANINLTPFEVFPGYCLALLSQHLLELGQAYYTKWIDNVAQAQLHTPHVATRTLERLVHALHIEQHYSILNRLCTRFDPYYLN